MKSNISGFSEFLPNEQIAFNRVLSVIKHHFESYGFSPLDTPAVERISTLLAKGNDNEIYGLFRLADENAKKEIGLRFDLTVPLARYVSQHVNDITFPYKRYHIAPVWRGERPQAGRYRQFYQCDIDVINNDLLSSEYDVEILIILTKTLQAIGVPNFVTKINNRKILTGFLSNFVADDKIAEAVRIIDKKSKITTVDFHEMLAPVLNQRDDIDAIEQFLSIETCNSNSEIIKKLKSFDGNEEYKLGISELENIIVTLKQLDIDDVLVKISPSLARGLSYYTGIVYETVIKDNEAIGSIAGGGRYDNLTEMLSNKKYPGVGVTIGISRLVPFLIEIGALPTDKHSTADILVTVQDRQCLQEYLNIAQMLRSSGFYVETYLQDKNLKAQLTYARKKGITFVVIANKEEIAKERLIIRNLETQEQKIISKDELKTCKPCDV